MTLSKNRVSLKLQVHPVVYDFYQAQYGETFVIEKDDIISQIIPHILTLRPVDYKATRFPGYKTLDIVLHDFRFGRQNRSNGGVFVENRNHLSDNHQYYISRFLEKMFKRIFHNYMLAFCRSNTNVIQKEGILDFCLVYRIEENKINYEMLKKSWDRSSEKQQWKKEVSI